MTDAPPSPAGDDADDPLAFRVLNEVAIINQLASRAFETALPPGLSLAQFSVLNHLVRLGDDRTPARIAAAFQVPRPTMTHTLGRLAAAGLVRLVADPEDGRGKRVRLTPAGEAMRRRAVDATAPLLAELGEAVPEPLLAALLPLLADLRARLDAAREV